jgi:predicted nucleotidyltransferase
MKFVDDTKVPDQPYPELREVLALFVEKVSAALKENLVGIYLVGSLASGDFDLDSDVDFMVVTHSELTEKDMQPLQDIQIQIHAIDCYPARHLEGSYISLGDLNDANTVGQKKLYYFDNGSTAYELSTHDNQWHVRWILRERGITLAGPKPETLLGPIPLDEMYKEIKAAMREVIKYFEEDINAPRSFWNSRFGQPFTVLTYCRMLHSLHTGTVQSKKAGAAWAKEFVAPKWGKVIDEAWTERGGVRFMEKIFQRAEQAVLNETLEFMKYALALIDNVGV